MGNEYPYDSKNKYDHHLGEIGSFPHPWTVIIAQHLHTNWNKAP